MARSAKDRGCVQLLIEVPTELHYELKMAAVKRNITLKTWILRTIGRELDKEKKHE